MPFRQVKVINEAINAITDIASNTAIMFISANTAITVVLIHLSKGQLSKDHFVQRTLVQEDFCPRRPWSKETFVQGVKFETLMAVHFIFFPFYNELIS